MHVIFRLANLQNMLKAQTHIQKYLKTYPFMPKVISALAPYQPQLVGGTIRTAFWNPELFESNIPYTDLDITINVTDFNESNDISRVISSLESHEIEYFKRGNNRNMLLKFTVDATRQSIDLTGLQKQIDGSGFVPADSWKDCMSHRDLKCNSFCYDLVEEKLYDHVDENTDLEGDCSVRFLKDTALQTDPGRMFRFFKFVAEKYDVKNMEIEENEDMVETSHDYDEKSIEKILENKIICTQVPSRLRCLKQILKYQDSGLVLNKIIDLGLSEEFFLVNLGEADLPKSCTLQNISDKLEHIQDIPKLCEAFEVNKREHDDLILKRIGQQIDLEGMIDDKGYVYTANRMDDLVRELFPTSPFTFDNESLIQVGCNRAAILTKRRYPVVRLPKKAYMKEYLVLNC